MAQSLAVLVDGDYISGKHAAKIRSVATKHGQPAVVRVYSDAQRCSEWHGVVGYRMLHTGSGENAADILLALDALELVLSKDMRCFVVASSDGDFTHLATRLREHGATVIGIAEAKAPRAFRTCCDEFVEIGTTRPNCAVQKPATIVTALDLNIRTMIASHSRQGAGMRIAEFAPKMHSKHGVRISTYSERRWRAYLVARPQLYELDPRGLEAMVRFRPDGFSQAV